VIWIFFVGTCNPLTNLTLMKLCLQLRLIETMAFSCWIHPWTYNMKLSQENKSLVLFLSFFPTWDHLSKSIFSYYSSESAIILWCLSNFHHMSTSSFKCIYTHNFHVLSHNEFIYFMYYSILRPSYFLVKYILLVKTQKIELGFPRESLTFQWISFM
jgi:hypothetical protein